MASDRPTEGFRVRRCFDPTRNALFTICASCDRGQRYCSYGCRQRMRQQQMRALGRPQPQLFYRCPFGQRANEDLYRTFCRADPLVRGRPPGRPADLYSNLDTANEYPRPLQSNETAGKKPRKLNSVGPNSHLCSHFIPPMTPESSPIFPCHISPENLVTARISMKTLIKPRMPFFPSCILVLGVLFSPERAACGDTPTSSQFCAEFFAPAARSVLPFVAPRIFDN
jgi:hypothetical protein